MTRFVTFEHNGQVRAGVLLAPHAGRSAQIIDGAHPSRPDILRALRPQLMDWIADGLPALAHAIDASDIDPACLLPAGQCRLLAPLPGAGKVVGAAFNYRDGLALTGKPAPTEPVIFIRSATTLIGPDDTVRLPPDALVTYEAELAVIIGRQALNVPRAQAMAHVAGYVLFNDVSITSYTREDGGAFVRGKNQPATGPIGPWIVPAGGLHDPHDLPLSLEADGRVLQQGNTADMLFRIDALIAYISARMPLDPGDIVATGTPAGVAFNHDPPAWLAPGMRMTIRAPGLGELANPVEQGTS